jgi:threonine dehydrogenase-like Zn-dependent dehydrogenase
VEGSALIDGRLALLAKPERFELMRRPVLEPSAHDVLIRVHACGICGSDLKMYAGTHAFLRPPLILGHELYGTVERVGLEAAAAGVQVGDSVCVFPPVGCGECFHCRSDNPQLCEQMEFFGGQRPGGLADYILVPSTNALPIPDDVPEESRVLIEPLSVAVHGVARGLVEQDERAVVLGAGAIGLFTALVLRARGLDDILVLDPRAARRERAGRFGFPTADPTGTDLRSIVADRVRPEGADCVFECVGSGETIAAALRSTRKGGRAVVLGNAPPVLELDGLTLQRGDRSLVGVLMYARRDFEESMRLLAGGLLADADPAQITDRFPLDDVGNAFRAAKSGLIAGLRVVVES